MTVIRCAWSDCVNNSQGICMASVVFLKSSRYEGFGCDTYESEDERRERMERSPMVPKTEND